MPSVWKKGIGKQHLYQLWHSSQTLNTDKPLASHLTTEYNGHYKPGTSNNWNSKCFDQFYISGHTSPGDSCDSFGWMMISTKATCFYEAGDAKPTFYYAPGTGLANWAMNNPLTGDLFVIQGRPTCNTGPSGQPTTTGTISTTAIIPKVRCGQTVAA
ncbi:hypothetical protein DPMN_173123 [Dreissena polymorpha]|uniref:Uncharacterized protein n=1 Tax=Dreissena polymorpha TaxID=45954 RepID=A0A9D4E426_DREPO|nr:hypothetical protein DPMN_173123 [Dreissena polymorpha]